MVLADRRVQRQARGAGQRTLRPAAERHHPHARPAAADLPQLPADLLAAIDRANLRAHWSNTVGLGFRIQTPLGGALAVDYGFLLNPPRFVIPQRGPDGISFDGTPAIYQLGRTQLHFRITQTF